MTTWRRGRTLAEAGQLPLWAPAAPAGAISDASPELPRLIAQDALEPLLREAAVAAGATVRFGTELAGFREAGRRPDLVDLGAARAELAPGTWWPRTARAAACASPWASAGPGRGIVGRPSVSVYFRADLARPSAAASSTCARSITPTRPAGWPPLTGGAAGCS